MTQPNQFHQEAYEDMLKTLQREPMTVEALSIRYEINERTVYRWLKYARVDGWDIIRRGTRPPAYLVLT